MSTTVSITSQGQVSIPAAIRRQLGLSLGGKAVVSVQDNKMIVEPVPDFLSLKGSLQTNKPALSAREIHEQFSKFRTKSLRKK